MVDTLLERGKVALSLGSLWKVQDLIKPRKVKATLSLSYTLIDFLYYMRIYSDYGSLNCVRDITSPGLPKSIIWQEI